MNTSDPQVKPKLKFRDPGARDTILRLHPKPAAPKPEAQEAAQVPATEQPASSNQLIEKPENPLLTKIKQILAQSDPDKWERAGEDLNTSQKYPKPYENWEMAYHMMIPSGVLVARCSLPVKSQYFGGGYTVTPAARPIYTVELRARGWDARTLIDPYFRTSLDKDKQLKVLADGDIAEVVFDKVRETVSSFTGARKRDFNNAVATLCSGLLAKAHATSAEDWSKSERDTTTTVFSATLDDIDVEVTCIAPDENNKTYRLNFTKEEHTLKSTDAGLAKGLFETVDEKLRNASLVALTQVLEDAGF